MARRDEVDEFLRRAAARRAQAQGQRPPQPRPPQQPQFNPPPPQKFRPPELTIVDADVVDAELADTDRVGNLVARDLAGTQQFAERTRHLGEEVDQADDKLAAHLQQVFDHRVGNLKARATQSVPAPLPGPAASAPTLSSSDLSHMLSSPQQLRNAIILNEILQRPVDRW